MLKKILVILSFVALLPMQAMAHETGPREVVETAVNGVIDVLKSRKDQASLSAEDRAAVRKAVEGYFDFGEMAKRSLGKSWKKMNRAQKTEFVNTFRELLERSYGNRLSDYSDQKVEFADAKIKKRIAIVNSEVIDTDKRTPVRYKLVHKKDGWHVYDIKIEGISMISTYRTDFTASVNKNGIDGFLVNLKQRVANLREQDQSAS